MAIWLQWLIVVGGIFALSQVTSLYTSIYLHRAMAHRSIVLHPFVAWWMRFHMWFFTGQTARSWVAVHLKHHRYSDKEGDPHSPHLKGVWNIWFLHEWHYGKEANNRETVAQYGKNVKKSKWDFLLENMLFGIGAGLAAFVGVFVLWKGIWPGALFGVLAYAAQLFIYVKAGATINSICHFFGYRNFDDNKATNVWWAGLLIAGEGWHNNHHHDISSPKMSYLKSEFDPSWLVIKLLTCVGLAKILCTTINENEAKKRESAAAP